MADASGDERVTVVESEAEGGLHAASATDRGNRRSGNEDSHLAEFPVYIVADGMGGHDAGDVASAAVIRAFTPLVGRRDVRPDEVADVIRKAHQSVVSISDHTPRGAGSTLTGVVQVRHDGVPYWLVVNVGDSRVYRVRGSRFERMTIDHSIMQEQLDAGLLTLEEAETFAHKNVITRAVGAPDSPPDYWVHPVEPGERLMICSDGLHGEVAEADMFELLEANPDPADAVRALVDRALENGGHDNVTVIVVDVQHEAATDA
ncbi:PP2C family protein-serine/threonine phosphatase [Gryllotalpicola ginsengisoli]|uniref:PP2C family protein-serine/threonine phosphatase n=1 Tax=Gryllotalpicola ginsengisoli TaxID=444608 RepID=UPI00041CC6CA|nr:protein phosphatase 2C domain-containing protein [Gryllotalpicola ginsengisoli]